MVQRIGKKVIALSLLVMLVGLCASAHVFAEDVYVTQNGQKYHKQDCRLIKNKNPQKITKVAAQEKELKPCGRCYKEDLSMTVREPIQLKVTAKK